MELDAASRSVLIEESSYPNIGHSRDAGNGASSTADPGATGTAKAKCELSSVGELQAKSSIRLEVEEVKLLEKKGCVVPNPLVFHRAIIVAPIFLIALAIAIAAFVLDVWLQNTSKEFIRTMDSVPFINDRDAILAMTSAGVFHLCLSAQASKFSNYSYFHMEEPGCTRNSTIIRSFYGTIDSSAGFKIPTAVQAGAWVCGFFFLFVVTSFGSSMCMYWVMYKGGKRWKFQSLMVTTVATISLAVAAAVSVLAVWGEISAVATEHINQVDSNIAFLTGISYWLFLASAVLICVAGFTMAIH